jgi:hypothetical protein
MILVISSYKSDNAQNTLFIMIKVTTFMVFNNLTQVIAHAGFSLHQINERNI